VCEETVGKHIANVRLNLSMSFSCDYRLPLSRGYCSMVFAKATAVAAKVKRKDSRKTLLSTKSWVVFLAHIARTENQRTEALDTECEWNF
jgi:hypothetical protein